MEEEALTGLIVLQTFAEKRINVMDAFDKSKDTSEKDNLSREANRLLDLQMSIQERDERFSRALSLFDAPPSDRP